MGQNREIKTWRINLTSQIRGGKDLKIIIKKMIDGDTQKLSYNQKIAVSEEKS